jgi:PAS domain S-box-containing protein
MEAIDMAESKILIIDDDVGICETLDDILQEKGYSVVTAGTGSEAIDRAGQTAFDVALIDISLPDMQMDLLASLKEIEPDLVVIMITADASMKNIVRALNEGASAYITKPLNMDEVLAKVREALEKRRLVIENKRLLYEIQQALSERKKAEQALQAEKEKFRFLVEESPFGISLIGKDGDYKYVSPKFVDMFGYALEEVPTGREWFRKVYPDKKYRKQVISTWITAIEETKVGQAKTLIYTVICKDGSKKVIKFLPVKMAGGDYLVIYEDITEQKKLEAKLIQSQKMEAIGRLAGGVAHDFNNILTTIIGNTGLMLMHKYKEDHIRECLEEIKDAGMRAAALIRQLLAFSRKQTLRLEVLNLNEVAADINKMIKRLIGEDVKVRTFFESDLLQVKADRSKLEQIIMNLAVNAKEAMPHGGELTFETKNAYLDESYGSEHGVEPKPGHYVILTVSDTGIGMEKETKSHIFEPFFTSKETGLGTGLGLATVYGIIKQMSGYIWVYSELGQGTTFKIYLPAVKTAAAPAQKKITSLERFIGSETVLLVEDDKSLRNLARKILKLYGYNVLETENGGDAIKVAEEYEKPIHLIITDVVMFGMNGRELAERIQSIRPEIRMIYMSGYTDNAISHHGVLEPGTNFIEKPFTPKSLMRKIREVLDS